MNLGFAKEAAKASAELDPRAEFREGVELLKNEYPQKALVRFRRAFESDKHNPTTFRFWDCRSHAHNGSGIKRRSFAR